MRKRNLEKGLLIQEDRLSGCVLNVGKLKLNLDVDVTSADCLGLVIRTYYPLEPGDLLNFNYQLEPGIGVVMWSNKGKDNNFIAGISFVKDYASMCYV